MKLTTVLSCVNNNSNYYLFIPKQILFWGKFNIKFIAVFVGEKIPDELMDYKDNIILWNNNLDLHTAFVGQNLRIYFPAMIHLPDDELIMITDMDMLPTKPDYYCSGLEHFNKDDFIYYRYVDGNQIYMCYNAAHPSIWQKVFNVYNENDIINKINETYNVSYNGVPGSTNWCIDQEVMYSKLINYPHLKILNRPISRLEVYDYINRLNHGQDNFLKYYDDVHFHRNYKNNEPLILHAEYQLLQYNP